MCCNPNEELHLRPGQLEPNGFELAILERIAEEHPSIRPHFGRLHVLSREFTGVGSFTTFKFEDSGRDQWDRVLGLDRIINMLGVPIGLGATLFCRGDRPDFLEIYTFGGENWDGVYDGFSFDETK